jgi:hypothetical protein
MIFYDAKYVNVKLFAFPEIAIGKLDYQVVQLQGQLGIRSNRRGHLFSSDLERESNVQRQGRTPPLSHAKLREDSYINDKRGDADENPKQEPRPARHARSP